ncbi:O-antigen polymerase [Streptomyces sp. NPDC059373]
MAVHTPVTEPADIDMPVVSPRAVLSRALAVPLFLGLGLALPAVVAVQSGPGLHDEVYWLQLVFTCYAGIRLAAMALTARRKLIQGSFWLFVYVAMGVAPLIQDVLEETPTPVVGSRSDLLAAVALVLFGCVAFDIGSLLARNGAAVFRRRRGDRSATFHRRRLFLLVVIAFVGSALLVVKLGGPSVFFTSRQAITDTIKADGGASSESNVGSAFLRGFGTVPALLALLIFTRWLVTSRTARRRPLVIATWFALLALNAVVNNPISNPRYWFLTVLFSFLFTAFPRSPAMYRTVLALGVLGALVIFPYADRFRYDSSGYKPVQATSVFEPLAIKDYDQIAMFANTITFSESGPGHFYGRQLAGSTFFFVPRSVWSGKPRDTGVMIGQWMGMTNVNLSSPMWAELWIDFGWPGVVAGFLGLGYAAARGDRIYALRTADDSRSGNVMAIVIPLIAGYSFILLRGPLLQASGRIGVALICFALVTTFRPDTRKHLR